MWIAYPERIRESVAELREQERALRGQRRADRVKLLRLLKSGLERSLSGAAAVLGYSSRQAQRWWRRYQGGGLAALVRQGPRGGSAERITPAAWDGLSAEMRAGRIGRLKDAQAYLREQWGIAYCLDALSKLFRRRKTKLKTGRPRHRRSAAAAQAAFKKGARGHAGAAQGSACLRAG